MRKDSRAAKRSARSIRRASSAKRSAGSADAADHAGGAGRPARRRGSVMAPAASAAMALTVKSRRARSGASSRSKVDPVRMAAVGIAGLGTERRDLVGHAPAHDRDRAVARTRQDGAVRGKAGLRLLRRGARADIPVLRRAAEQAVAHAATDRIGRKTRRVQLPEQCLNLRRDRDAGRHFVSRRGSLQYGQSSIFPRLAGSTRWQCGQR